MAPPLTLLSFADLNNNPPSPPTGQGRLRRNVIDPLRWCQQHLDALRIHISPHSQAEPKGVLFSFSTAEEFAIKVHNFDIIRRLLCTLQRPVVSDPGFFGVAWTISSFLSSNPWLSRGPTPVGYGNSHVLNAFVWLLNCMMGPRITMSVQRVQEQYCLRTLEYRNHTIRLIPDLCIVVQPRFGSALCIPVFFPEIHRRARTALAPEIAFILACAQQHFRDMDTHQATDNPPALAPNAAVGRVAIMVLRVNLRETYFISATVTRSYLESVKRTGAPDAGLNVMRSPRWDLKSPEGRVGFYMGLKGVTDIMFPRLVQEVEVGEKRKSELIS